jgi:hypothetical protein
LEMFLKLKWIWIWYHHTKCKIYLQRNKCIR